jgi:Na+-translocating ferredoxin:NAD+ oxidoreductase subunit G
MNKNLPFKMILVMTIITAVSGLVLSGIWSVSEDKISRNEKAKVIDSLFEINPAATKYEKLDMSEEVYKCFDKKGRLLSYFFIAEGNGFQALIRIAVSVEPDWKEIIGIRILEQTETPGLGAKITEKSFLDKFANLALLENSPITCLKKDAHKSKSEILAITSATISSKAVANIINDRISTIKYLIPER